MKMETRSTWLTLPIASPPKSCVSNCKWKGPFVLITSPVRVTTATPSPSGAPTRHQAGTAVPRPCQLPRAPGVPARRAPCRGGKWAGLCQGLQAGRRGKWLRVHSRGQGGVEPKVGAFEGREGYGGSAGSLKPICVLGGALRLQGGGERRGASRGVAMAISAFPIPPHPDHSPLPKPGARVPRGGRTGPGGRGGGGTAAYPWCAAGSQAPGSRALRTALFRRAQSW